MYPLSRCSTMVESVSRLATSSRTPLTTTVAGTSLNPISWQRVGENSCLLLRFGPEGNLEDWWSNDTATEFHTRAECLVWAINVWSMSCQCLVWAINVWSMYGQCLVRSIIISTLNLLQSHQYLIISPFNISSSIVIFSPRWISTMTWVLVTQRSTAGLKRILLQVFKNLSTETLWVRTLLTTVDWRRLIWDSLTIKRSWRLRFPGKLFSKA